MEILVVVALVSLAGLLGFGAGLAVMNQVRRADVAERDRRIAELERKLASGGPATNGRWHR